MLPDIAVLLVPINPASPCGADLSFSEDFDRIQDARRADDDSLDAGEWVRELKRADWPRVVDGAVELLSTRTKDLRLAVWLAEALAKTEGFAGLACGFDIVRAMLEAHWHDLHPQMEDSDTQERSGNLAWLFARGAELIREIPLVRTEQEAFCWNDFESARALQMQMDRDPDHASALAYGRVTVARLQAAQAATPRAFYEEQYRDFPLVGEAGRALEKIVDEKLGDDGPSTSVFRDAVAAVTAVVERLWQQAGLGGSQPSPADTSTPSLTDPGTTVGGPIQSRQQALQMLRLVAEYFRRTEPHSPVTYLAEKAARWGDLPLHAWLRQVIHDPGVLGRLEELLGTEAPGDSQKN
jgi:type VI secretion system protein ImpA